MSLKTLNYFEIHSFQVQSQHSCFNRCQPQVIGPLTMYPAADDNYGLDACSLLCLHSQPPVIAMATASGKIYHCIVLESEESYDPEKVV